MPLTPVDPRTAHRLTPPQQTKRKIRQTAPNFLPANANARHERARHSDLRADGRSHLQNDRNGIGRSDQTNGMQRSDWPPIDFSLYGLDRGWTGPRWLEHVEGAIGEQAAGIWLAHSPRRVPTRGHQWVMVGTFRPRSDNEAKERELARDLAFSGLAVLINELIPDLEESDRRRFRRNSIIYLERRAARHATWTQTRWMVDGKPLAARFARFAGGWSGYAVAPTGTGLAVVATSAPPDAPRLVRLESGAEYNFALAEPIIHPTTLQQSVDRALGTNAWPVPSRRPHADHRRILQVDT